MLKQDNVRLPIKIKLFILINLAVLFLATVYIFYTGNRAGEIAGEGVFYLSSSGTAFTFDDVSKIAERFENYNISYEASGMVFLENEIMSAYSPVTYTNAVYAEMNSFRFAYGSFFAENDGNVIVLNEALAWKLFGNLDVCGFKVTANGRELIVIGVVENGKYGQENFMAWLPYNRQGYMAADIYHLFVKAHKYNKINGYRDAEKIINYIYVNRSGYSIVDINEYVLSIQRRLIYLISLVCCILILVLAVFAYKIAEDGVQSKQSSAAAAVTIIRIVILLSVIAFLFTRINFDIWIPGFNGGGIGQFWTTFTNEGILPGQEYLPVILKPLIELNENANLAMTAGLVALLNILLTAPIYKKL